MEKNFFLNAFAFCMAVALPLFTSCSSDDNEPEKEPYVPTEYYYVLNSGKGGNNNASLTLYDVEKGTATQGFFNTQNGRKLGDTGQDIIVYGSKIYIAMYGESRIEITDMEAKSIKYIDTEGQPRTFLTHNGKVYVTYYNGYVARIDTTSLAVESKVQVGRNPEKMAVANGKIYVTNSGGMDYNTEVGYDKTVSVIDIASFTETKKIEIVLNPCEIVSYNNSVYVVSTGNYGDIPNTLQKIDAATDAVSVVEGFDGTFLAASDNVLYTIHSQYDASWNQVITYYSYDMSANKVLSDNFVGNTEIIKPYQICTDAASGNLFITSSDYTNDGDVYVFDKSINFVTKFETGLNPMKVVYVKK